MFQTIDENIENQKAKELADKITPDMLGLKPTNDFAQYSNERIINEVPEYVSEWNNKGPIGVMEAGKMFANEFDGTYGNVYTNAQQRQDFLNKHQKIKEYSNSVDERIAKNKQNKLERNQRVNEGTGSFFDRAGAFLDRLGNSQYNAQVEYAKKQDDLVRPKKDDPNYKYVPLGLDRAGNVVYDEIDLREKIGFVEALRGSVSSGKATPFVGGTIEAKANNRIESIQEKIRNGEQITQEELEHFNRYKNHEYEKQIRGYSIGGNIGESVLPSIFAFGSELALGGAVLKGIGLAGKGVQAGQKITQGLLKANKLGKAGEAVAKGAGYAAGQLAEGALGASATLAVNMPTRVWAAYSERRLNDQIKITDHGTVIFTEAKETPAKAFMKSMGSTFVSYFSEHMGGLIGATVFKPLGMIAQKAVNNSATKGLMGAGAKQFEKIVSANPQLTKFVNDTVPLLSKAYEKLNGLPIKGKSVDWLKSKVKFDGFMEELGEEVLEDVLNITIGTNYEERSLDNYVKAIVKTPEEWAVLAGTIALQGGALSLAGNLLGDAMQRSGVDEEKIVEVLANSTENEKQELISELIDNNTIQLNEITNEERENKEALKAHIEKNVYEKLVGANVSQEEADNVAITVSSMFGKYGNNEESRNIIDKIFDKLKIRYNVPAGKRAQEDNTQYQSAAMYKNKTFETVEEFAKNVSENINNYKKEKMPIAGKKLSIPADVIQHDKKHNLKPNEWQEIADNIDNIFIANKTNDSNSYSNNNYKVGIKSKNGNFYALVIGINKKDNLICTAFKTTENGVISFVENKKNSPSLMSTSNPSTPSNINIAPDVSQSKDYTNIINYVLDNLNPDELTVEEMLKGVKDADGKAYFQPAFHGSPHKFDKFSLDAIGTGEGNQAHGWGLYFAGDKNVSEGYRKGLIDKNNTTKYEYDGQPIEETKYKDITLDVLSFISTFGKNATIEDIQDDIKYAIEWGKNNKRKQSKKTLDSNNDFIKRKQNELELVKELDFEKIVMTEGQLFEVDIPENDVLLNEDKKFSEQPEKVQKALIKLADENLSINKNELFNFTAIPVGVYLNGKEIGEGEFAEFPISIEIAKRYGKNIAIENLNNEKNSTNFNDMSLQEARETIARLDEYIEYIKNLNLDNITIDERKFNKEEFENKYGEQIYNYIAKFLGSPKNASILLNQYGIKGITYDGMQDGRCYVIFDDKAVNVIKTYFQETNDGVDEFGNPLVAGFSVEEIGVKLTELYAQLDNLDENKDKKLIDEIITKANVLSEVIDPNIKHSEEDYLNAYQIMTEDKISQDYVEENKNSQRYISEYKDLVRKKKEEKEASYRGYFEKQNKTESVITLMKSKNASTALHEFGHLFLETLNDLASVDEKAREDLKAINKFLGANGEYTREQHEKFAGSFEAYIWTGKAPTNKLKNAFERFKEWLRAVYENITDIPNAEISPEVQKLFDGIFGGEEYYENKKQSKELLEKVKKSTSPKKKEKYTPDEVETLSDEAKRHKETAYEIISVATGKNIKYLKSIFETEKVTNAVSKKRENVMREVEDSEDKIAVAGGMQENWIEFFGKANVDYENNDVGGSEDLAHQALDVIINKNYINSDKLDDYENERALAMQKYIDDMDRQYSVLMLEFKRGNEQKRTVALAAFNEWLEDVSSDMQEDYYNRFLSDVGVIERRENQDKFAKAKENIINAAINIRNKYSINDNEAYKELVLKTMNNLDFLQPSDKAKMTTQILDISSFNDLEYRINNILDIAKTMEDVRLRQNMMSEIHKELQGTKNVKKGARTVGKYDYKTNKLFEELRRIDKLTTEQANEERLNRDYTKAEDEGLSFQDKIINKFLSYKANGSIYADSEQIKSLYDDILRIKLAGKNAKDEAELFEKLDDSKDVEELVNILKKKKKGGKVIKGYIIGIANLESCLNAIFNKKIKDKYGAEILYAETQAQAWQHQQKTKFENKVAEIYNLPQWNWDERIIQYLSEKHTYQEYRRKYDKSGNLVKEMTVDREMSKMDIIQAYIWSLNEVLNKRLVNQFGKKQLEAMFDEMSLEDIKLAETMVQTAGSFYSLVNNEFIRKYGLDLPKVSCYFPSTPERGAEVDLFNDYSAKTMNNSFTKQRVNAENVPMEFHNPVAILYNHIDGVAKFAFMGEQLDKANRVLKNIEFVKPLIINKYGEDTYKTLTQALANVSYKKEATVFNGVSKIFDNLIGNWIQANVAIKPIVGLKQLLSANNYAVDMPYLSWQKGFLKALANPKETIDYVMNIPYIKARYEGSFSNEFLKQTIENSAFAKSKKLKDCCNLFIKLGDIGAIIFGGKPYIDYLINEKGMSEDEAIKRFILSTNRSQQSSAVSSLSNFQVNMTRNPIGKLFIAFKNSPQQYIRMCGDAIVSVVNGDMSKTQCAKLLYQFGYLQPFLYAAATSGSFLRWLFAGDDDDLLKDLSVSIFNLGSDALPIIGDAYKYTMNKLLYKEKYTPQTTPLLGDIEREISRISKDDADLSDWLESIGYLGLHIGLGYNSKAIGSMGQGVGEIFKGNVVEGSMKVLGYTDKRAKHIAGNEKKSKKTIK